MKLRLREILKERSLTLKAFSELSGISRPNLSNYVNGNTSPTLEMLNRMADTLSISTSELLEEEEPIDVYVRYKDKMVHITKQDIETIMRLKGI